MDYIHYPRTLHLPFSKEDLSPSLMKANTDFPQLKDNETFVIEEKMDGIGVGIFFHNADIRVQQRGHVYTMDSLPSCLNGLKLWLYQKEESLYCIAGEDKVVFGEWLEYKHTVFYNNLPDLFLEYDIFDRSGQCFLSTAKRYALTSPTEICSVPVCGHTYSLDLNKIQTFIEQANPCFGKTSDWREEYEKHISHSCSGVTTLMDNLPEGLYIKIENDISVTARYKWIRHRFMETILHSEHWKKQPPVRNLCASATFKPKI